MDYLAREVPRWPRENHCFSCHNNGDGARALYVAGRQGYTIPKSALEDTGRWLGQPDNWDNNHGNPGFSDTKLARIQFASALAEGMTDRQALAAAAESLLPYLRGVLERAGRTRFAAPIARADRWFLAATPGNLLDTSVLLLAMPDSEDLKRNQTTDSGWGPQPNRPAEVFDTAIALMALQAVGETKPISRGRAYGVGSLRTTNDGPETTVILFHVKQRE